MPSQTDSLTTLQTGPIAFLQELKQTHQPITLTIDGTPAAIIQDIAGYQRLLDLAALASETEEIRQAKEDPRSRSIEEFFAELQVRHGIPD